MGVGVIVGVAVVVVVMIVVVGVGVADLVVVLGLGVVVMLVMVLVRGLGVGVRGFGGLAVLADVDAGGGDSAAVDLLYLEADVEMECGGGVVEKRAPRTSRKKGPD